MKKGLYFLSVLFLIVCLILSVISFATASGDLISGESALSLIHLFLGGIGMIIFMFEWDIVFPCLFVLLAVIVVSFVYAIRKKMLAKSTIIALVAINSVSVALIVARAIVWFMLYSTL